MPKGHAALLLFSPKSSLLSFRRHRWSDAEEVSGCRLRANRHVLWHHDSYVHPVTRQGVACNS